MPMESSSAYRGRTPLGLSARDEGFPYKEGARRVYYDIESLPSLFTCTFWDGRKATLWFIGSRAYAHVSAESLATAFGDYMRDPEHRKTLGLTDDDPEPLVEVVRFDGYTTAGAQAFNGAVSRFLACEPLPTDGPENGADTPTRFTEYVGWNSYNYDLPMFAIIGADLTPYIGSGVEIDLPRHIRLLSDTVIGYDGPTIKLGEVISERLRLEGLTYYDERAFRQEWGQALYNDGHIDIAKEEARLGMDIIADANVSVSDPNAVLPDDELLDFVRYNLHDVAATSAIGRSRDVKNRIFVRDVVRKMFPYTAARAIPFTKVADWQVPERDITEAELTALSLIGPKRIKPVDYDGVSYEFPLPDGRGGHVKQDLLEYMRRTERYMPDDLHRFFAHWRGKDTREWDDFFRALFSQPLTHASTANIPYYRIGADGKPHPTDSYIRISTGGAHGGVMSGLRDYTPEQIRAWTRANGDIKAELVPTLDLLNVVHADFTSYYPYLMMKMEAFMTEEGVDRYRDIYTERVGIKEALSKFPDRSTWGPEQRDMSDRQLGLKLQLNSATGKANTHKKYAKLPIDNKILSMRLIGNMSIWCLAQRMTHAGGFVVSTNTDGIYVANISLERAQEVIDGFVADYDILVDPETVPRFINRDTSNRMEFIHMDYPNDVRGKMRSGTKLAFDDSEHGHDVTYPLAVGNAVVRYISEDVDWLHKPYDRERMRGLLAENVERGDAMSWVKVQASNAKNRLLVDGKLVQKIDRVVLTRDGVPLTQESCAVTSRDDSWAVWYAFTHGATTFAEIAEETGLTLIDENLLYGRKFLCNFFQHSFQCFLVLQILQFFR